MTPEERRGTLRIMDANLNRAVEALRVAEDVCRFHWSLPSFGEELKELRHAVFRATFSTGLRHEELLRCRDIEGDVGRDLDSPDSGPLDPATLAMRNLVRAKEALRTLEEAARLAGPTATPAFEACRYRLYSIEKGLAHLRPLGDLPERISQARLYLLATAELAERPLAEVVREAVAAGCDVVQLREKEVPARELLAAARDLREITARAGVLFIVNDRPDLALLSHADGVHLGQDDLPVAEARSIVGPRRLVGVSTHSLEQALAAQSCGADYVGIGPLFPTGTKPTAGAPIGSGDLRDVLRAISVPAFAIGGIEPANLATLTAVGCHRIAVSSAVLSAPNASEAVAALRRGLGAERVRPTEPGPSTGR